MSGGLGFAAGPPIGGFLYSVECLKTHGTMLTFTIMISSLVIILGRRIQAAVHHCGCIGTAVCDTNVLPRWKHEYVSYALEKSPR